MDHVSTPPTALNVPASTAKQFSYHVRLAALFPVAGETGESASESVLAWAILATAWPEAPTAAADVAAELVGQHQVSLSDAHRRAALDRACGLALELESHFASVGCRDETELYAAVADQLETTIGALVNEH